jgi:hypothetical protein
MSTAILNLASDVDVATLADGDILVWNNTSKKWVHGTTVTLTAATIATLTSTTETVTTINVTDINASGVLTSTGSVLLSSANALSGAGTVRGNATAVTKDRNNFTTVSSGTGAVLPAAATGREITVNNAGASALQVYAAGSDTIDGVAGATGVPLTNAKRAVFICFAAPAWISAQLGVVSA